MSPALLFAFEMRNEELHLFAIYCAVHPFRIQNEE